MSATSAILIFYAIYTRKGQNSKRGYCQSESGSGMMWLLKQGYSNIYVSGDSLELPSPPRRRSPHLSVIVTVMRRLVSLETYKMIESIREVWGMLIVFLYRSY